MTRCDPRRVRVEHDNATHSAGLIARLAVVGVGAEVTNACRSGRDWAVYRRKDARGRSAETKQYVFGGIGGAAIIRGGVMYYLASQEQRPAPFAITPRSDGAVIAWSGSW